MRELDGWIDVNLFGGGKFVGLKKRGCWYRPDAKGYTDRESEAGRYTREEAKKHEYLHDERVTIHEFIPRHYTTDPAAGVMVLKKCAEKLSMDGYELVIGNPIFGINYKRYMVCTSNRRGHQVHAATWELAICLFANELFGAETAKV